MFSVFLPEYKVSYHDTLSYNVCQKTKQNKKHLRSTYLSGKYHARLVAKYLKMKRSAYLKGVYEPVCKAGMYINRVQVNEQPRSSKY